MGIGKRLRLMVCKDCGQSTAVVVDCQNIRRLCGQVLIVQIMEQVLIGGVPGAERFIFAMWIACKLEFALGNNQCLLAVDLLLFLLIQKRGYIGSLGKRRRF